MGKKTTTRKTTRVPKTCNAGTMTNSQFWGGIRAILRAKSRYWKPILLCKQMARRPYKGPLKKQKFEYQCNHCKQWFPEKMISVDHIIPAGTLKCAEDLPEFVTKLFVEVEGLQCLCDNCHSIKTLEETNNR